MLLANLEEEEKALVPLADKNSLANYQLLTCGSKIAGLALIGRQSDIFLKLYSVNNEPDDHCSLSGDSGGNIISPASGGLEVDAAALRLMEDGASLAEMELEGLEGGVTIP